MAAVKRSLNVGVVGMGRMGVPIARNLAFKARSEMYLQIHSRSLAKARRVCDDLSVDGATCAMRLHNRYATMTKWCDVILLVLADRGASARVLLEDPEALLPHARPGQLIVDHTTVDVALSRACAAAAAARGATFLDAPMNGSPRAVFNGQLGLMVGGAAEAHERLLPIFRLYADQIHHLGGPGSGSAAKLLAQALVASHNAAAAEAMTLANRLGLEDAGTLTRVLDASWGASTMLRRNAPTMQDLIRDPARPPPLSTASVDQLLEDLSLLDASLAQAAGPDAPEEKFPVLDSALRMLGAAAEAGMGDRDLAAVIHFIQAAVAIQREEEGEGEGERQRRPRGASRFAGEVLEPRGLTAGAFLDAPKQGAGQEERPPTPPADPPKVHPVDEPVGFPCEEFY